MKIKSIVITAIFSALLSSHALAGNGAGQQHKYQYKGSNGQASHKAAQKKNQYKGSKSTEGNGNQTNSQSRNQEQTQVQEPVPFAN
jgi:hypothetical protein